MIQEQNDTEFEIYPLAADIFAKSLSKNELSKRYVFARKKSRLGQIYYGLSSFPDIAIMTRDFKNEVNSEINKANWDKLKGCIEVKSYGKRLISLDDLKKSFNGGDISTEEGQILGEILWYKKVIYTNGIKWKLFIFKDFSSYTDQIIELVKQRIEEEKTNCNSKYKTDWYRDSFINQILKNNLEEKLITNNCLENWDCFIKNIDNIKWD